MKNYKKLFYWSDEDASYIVTVPSLPGCVTDDPDLAEAMRKADTVIREWIDFARELGNEVPEEDPESMESSSPTIFDLAGYILDHCGAMSAMKLQKLAYYCQAWCLGWYGQPLVNAAFEDWRDGPVCRELFNTHQGRRVVRPSGYSGAHRFTDTEIQALDAVISAYEDRDGTWLSRQTHREPPWRETRGDLPPGANDSKPISNELMKTYYRGL